jgi:hypothetical protein
MDEHTLSERLSSLENERTTMYDDIAAEESEGGSAPTATVTETEAPSGENIQTETMRGAERAEYEATPEGSDGDEDDPESSGGARRAQHPGSAPNLGGFQTAPCTEETAAFEENTWSVIKSYFKNPSALTAHQIDSYNDCLTNIIPAIVASEESQITIPFDFDQSSGTPRREYRLRWGDVSIGRPVLQENTGATTLLTPAEARKRNLTYSANLYVDMTHQLRSRGENGEWDEPEVQEHKRIQICKIPLMIGAQAPYFIALVLEPSTT